MRLSMIKAGSVLLIVLLCCVATTAFGAVGGSISGTIKDSSGGVVPGAMLTLTNTALGTQFKSITDGQGLYTFPTFPVGRYELTIDATGLKSQKKTGMAIDAARPLQVNTTV